MSNPHPPPERPIMTDDTQPEALRLANVCSNLTRYSMDAHLITAELRRQHARIAELEAELDAVGAGGVHALSAGPAIKPLVWSDESGPTDKIRYNHITAETALGQFSVEWKGWKEEDWPCVYLAGDYIGFASDLGSAKMLAEQHIHELVANLLAAPPALSAAPAGPWSLGEIDGNWRDIDLPDHGAVMRIVWKMEDDDGRKAKLEAQAHAVVAALNAASPTPQAEQPATTTKAATPKAAPGEPSYSEKWDAELGRTAMRFVDRAGDVHPGIDDAETICAEFHKAMSEVIERMPHVRRMTPHKEAPGVGNSGFDYKTAADFLNGKTVSDEAVRKFVAASRWAHDERAALSATLLAMHGVLTSREAEIALLKKALLD